jgi:hypothetical protein
MDLGMVPHLEQIDGDVPKNRDPITTDRQSGTKPDQTPQRPLRGLPPLAVRSNSSLQLN